MNNENNRAFGRFMQTKLLLYHLVSIGVITAIWWVILTANMQEKALDVLNEIDKPQIATMVKSIDLLVWEITKSSLDYPTPSNLDNLAKVRALVTLLKQLPSQLKHTDSGGLTSFSNRFFSQFIEIKGPEPTSFFNIDPILTPSLITQDAAMKLAKGDPEKFKNTFLKSAFLTGKYGFYYFATKIQGNDRYIFTTYNPEIITWGFSDIGERISIDVLVSFKESYFNTLCVGNHQLLTHTEKGGMLDTVIYQPGIYRVPVSLTTSWGLIKKTDTVTLEVFEK